ncbi:MAG: AtpZ/AtpI family protein [Flavobacteriales bacterium]|nr:AtpZ/AtpI family protein [Flavobacteriales bacterium]
MKKSKKPSQKPKQLNNLARLSGVGLQMGATIFLGAYAGKWLDQKYPSDKNWFTIGLTLLFVAIALFNVLRQVNKINSKNDKTN